MIIRRIREHVARQDWFAVAVDVRIIRNDCGDRGVQVEGCLVGFAVVVPCNPRIEPAAVAQAPRRVRAAPRPVKEMTRYIASLDKKLDQLGPGVDYSGTLRRALNATGSTRSP